MDRLLAEIAATGFYVPEDILTNKFFEQLRFFNPETGEHDLETSDDWITQRSGIKQRRRCAPDEYASDLAAKAAQDILETAHVDAKDLDFIIIATDTADRTFPSTAHLTADKLGITKLKTAFDVTNACAGGVNALDVGAMYIENRGYRQGLVIASETLTRIADYNDRSTCFLFGDGAAGVLLRANNEGRGIVGSAPNVDMSEGKLWWIYNGERAEDRTKDDVYVPFPGSGFRQGKLRMPQGPDVLVDAKKQMLYVAGVVCEQVGWNLKDVVIIAHDANERITKGISREIYQTKKNDPIHPNVLSNIRDYGNISCVTVFLKLAMEMRKEPVGKIVPGTKAIIVGYGSGPQAYAVAHQF